MKERPPVGSTVIIRLSENYFGTETWEFRDTKGKVVAHLGSMGLEVEPIDKKRTMPLTLTVDQVEAIPKGGKSK